MRDKPKLLDSNSRGGDRAVAVFFSMQTLGQMRRLWPSTYFLGVLLIFSAVLPLPRGNAIAGLPSICAFHNLTGLPCPGCGLTRSWVCLAHGHLGEALLWHPLGPLLFLAALSYVLWSAWVALNRPKFPVPQRLQNATIFVGLALMFGFWALRLAGLFPLPGG